MTSLVKLGNDSSLIIKIPARGSTNWSADFKTEFANKIADHDHSLGSGARIRHSALVNSDMVGDNFTDVNGVTTAYTASDIPVGTKNIQDAAVTKAKMANNSVGLDQLEKTVVITQDTTITTATYNTHFIIESTATSSVTLTFNAVEVSGCLFTRGGNTASPFTPIIKLIGAVDFNYNKIDMLNNGSLNINEVNLDTYKFVYNDISISSLLADVDGTDTGVSSSGSPGGTFTFNSLKMYSLSNSIKFPFGTSMVNKFEFLVAGSGTPTFQDHVMDSDGTIRTTYNVDGTASNIIIFNKGGVTYKTAVGTGSGTITTITDTKPFKMIDRLTKVSLDPALADLKDVSSTSPTTGQVLKWGGTEWAPATDQAGSSATVVLANQTDVNGYTPTPGDIISITATTDLTFSSELNGVAILKGNDTSKLIFNNNLFSCVIKTRGDIDFKNLNTDGTDIQARQCDIHCKDLDVSNSALNSRIDIYLSSIVCENIDVSSTGGHEQANLRSGTDVSCRSIAKIGVFGGNKSLAEGLYLRTAVLQGFMRVGSHSLSGNILTASQGTGSGEVRVETSGAGLPLINGGYSHPFTVNHYDINTDVFVTAKNTFTGDAAADNQLISSTSATKIVMDAEDRDNTSSYDVSNSKFTAKVRGTYSITLSMLYAAVTDGVSVNIYKNGSAPAAGAGLKFWSSQTYSTYSACDATALIELEVGDYLEFYADSYADSSYTISAAASRIFINKVN